MIPVSELAGYVKELPSEEVNDGVFRKYVDHNDLRIYLHPDDPRFGATRNGVFYSFRRPMGARGSQRMAGVHFGKPRELKGHTNRHGTIVITITPYQKRKKSDIISEIFQGNPLEGLVDG